MRSKNKRRRRLRKASRKLSAGTEALSLDEDGGGKRDVDTHVVGVVIFVVSQLDHAVGALDKGRGP